MKRLMNYLFEKRKNYQVLYKYTCIYFCKLKCYKRRKKKTITSMIVVSICGTLKMKYNRNIKCQLFISHTTLLEFIAVKF